MTAILDSLCDASVVASEEPKIIFINSGEINNLRRSIILNLNVTDFYFVIRNVLQLS
jgi:hypothetical protein